MIIVTYKPKTMEVKISGHAGYDRRGKDIVCSAVSILFYTLGEALMQSMDMMEDYPIVKDEEGDGLIVCTPKPEYRGKIARSYWTVTKGFEMLAEQYPKHVKFFVQK